MRSLAIRATLTCDASAGLLVLNLLPHHSPNSTTTNPSGIAKTPAAENRYGIASTNQSIGDPPSEN